MRWHTPLAVVVLALFGLGGCALAQTGPGRVTGRVYVKVKLIDVTPADRPVKLGCTLYAAVHQRVARFGLAKNGEVRVMNTTWGDRVRWEDLTEADTLRAGESTGWSDWTPFFATPEKQMTLCLAFWEDGLPPIAEAKLDGGNITGFEAEVSFASAPEDAAIVKTVHHRASHYNLALYLPNLEGPVSAWGPQICTLFEYAQRRLAIYQSLGAIQCPPAEQFIITGDSIRGYHTKLYDPDTDRLEDTIQSLLGVNTPLVRVPAVEALKLDPFDPQFTSNLRAKLLAAVPTIPAGRVCILIGDEPNVISLDTIRKSPAGPTAFRDWLQSQGIKPSDVGAETWEQVLPIGRSDVVDRLTARLYLETVWFQQITTALTFHRYTALCHQLWGDRVVTGTDAFYGSFTAQPDYFVESRFGAVDRQTHHFGSGEQGGGAKTVGNDLFLADLLRSASQQGTVRTGILWYPSRIAQGWGTLLSGVTALAHGMQRIHYYGYGPMYSGWEYFSDDRNKIDAFMAAAQISRMATQYERYLLEGARPPAQVGTVLSRSTPIWTKTTTEDMQTRFGWPDGRSPAGRLRLLEANIGGPQGWPVERRMMHAALGWASVPTDVVPEETLENGDLARYRVLYVQEPNLSAAAQQALEAWVRAGGILYLGPGAATRDELNAPRNLLEKLCGRTEVVTAVDAGSEDPFSKTSLYGEEQVQDLPILDRVHVDEAVCGESFAFPVVGRKEVLDIPGAQVLARYQGGDAAVAVLPVGFGKLIKSGVPLGAALCRSAAPAYAARRPGVPDPPFTVANNGAAVYFQREFQWHIQDLIIYPVRAAGVTPPVRTGRRGMDSGLFELSDGRGALLLLANYSLNNRGRMTADVSLQHAYPQVRSFSGQRVITTWTGTTAHLQLTADQVEAVEFLPEEVR